MLYLLRLSSEEAETLGSVKRVYPFPWAGSGGVRGIQKYWSSLFLQIQFKYTMSYQTPCAPSGTTLQNTNPFLSSVLSPPSFQAFEKLKPGARRGLFSPV